LIPIDERPRENPGIISGGRTSRRRFCALEYRGRNWDVSAQEEPSVILLVLEDGKSGLQFLAHPDWRRIVEAEDLDYIESLLQDFKGRAKLHPGALFKQVSSLQVGPLVTHEVGSRISDHPPLIELRSRLVQL
jgi:hypothetical protein